MNTTAHEPPHLETDSKPPRDSLEMLPAAASAPMTWTAAHLLGETAPAYGSDRASPKQPEPGTVYALPRRRVALDWSRACAADQ